MKKSSVFRKVLLLLVAAVCSVSAAERPNILVILCDDLGYGDLGCYGHPHIKTPNLDKLASQGMRLTDCYASAPVCSSSRAGMLTGRTPNRSGVYDWIPDGHVVHLRPTETTIATLLRKGGYDTAHVGKWHLNGKFNSDAQPQPGDHGFNHWFATQNNASPSHENPRNFVRNGKAVGPLEGFSCNLVAEEGIRWLKEGRKLDKPFFLNVWFHEPHEPVASPEKLVAQYRDVAKNEDEAQYFANVANMDVAVGQLMTALDEQGLTDNTFVYFTSDNGPETLKRYRGAGRSYGSPGPLRGMKLHIYEGGIREAGIIRWPGHARADQVVDTPVSAVDLLPTVCAMAGMKVPTDKPLDGASFLPIFQGQPITRTTPLFWAYYRSISSPKVAMRDGDWKLVAHWDGPEKPIGGNVNPESMKLIKSAKLTSFELYNLRNDIGEQHDLKEAETGRYKRMVATLRKKYLEVQQEGPIWLVPEK